MTIKSTEYKYRLLARFEIESQTPIVIGSGDKDFTTDALVMKDVNGLPYIPGTSLAGVLRSMLNTDKNSNFWGFQDKDKGHGSEIVFTEAKVIDSKGNVIDGLIDAKEISNDPVLSSYDELPVRQHVSITGRGTAAKTGKFDEQIVYAGTRFCFEMEIAAKSKETAQLDLLVNAVNKQSFRIGSGSRSGFGKVRINSVKTKVINLETDLKLYLEKSSNLNDAKLWWSNIEDTQLQENAIDEDYTCYRLELTPSDFFLFGSGFGDESGDADMTGVTELVIKNGKIEAGKTLIPATSVKGALRHRVAFHYNKLMKSKGEPMKAAAENEAVKALFGCIGEETKRGSILISDVYAEPCKQKRIPHVKIDRFTGGALDGALFTEKPMYANNTVFTINMLVPNTITDDNTKKALRMALSDICHGMLPLGGGVNRGNGIFNGKLYKDGKAI